MHTIPQHLTSFVLNPFFAKPFNADNNVQTIETQWRKSGSKSRGTLQGEAPKCRTSGRGLDARAERGRGSCGGHVPPPHQLRIMGNRCKLPQYTVPGDLAIFVEFVTQELILADSIIQSQC